MAEISLDGARVAAVVGELEPTSMAQHVGMNEKGEFRSQARPGHHALISGYGKRSAAFRDENVWGRWGFAQELAQRSTFPCRYRMHAGVPALGPAYMKSSGSEIDVVPAQRHQLRGSEAMAVGDHDRGGVAMPRAVLLGGLDEPLNLPAVASRCPERFCLAASMSRSTSRSVRYSRLLLTTVTFTEVEAAS
jgi:hypothetical protein